MATTAIWDVTDRLDRVIDYTTNPDKTENLDFNSSDFRGLQEVLKYAVQDAKTEKQFYVTGINCYPETACKQMSKTKLQFQKTDGILAFHGYQSFAPGEATPETAHAIGVKMAQELWGNRFEVVVSTHLDKNHLHNHFVLNSVSFKDGKRYYDNKTTYSLMRQTSDRLCREYSLSVIENPQRGKSKHYAEWKAEQESKPTWRGLIREDVDKAIDESMTFTQFIANLRRQGYEVKTGVKYMAVRPNGKERFVRLKTLGDDYTEENIKERILKNRTPKRPQVLPEPNRKRYTVRGCMNIRKTRKLTGLQALYFHYLYKMGILPKQCVSRKRTHFLLREDIWHMKQLISQTKLLCTHRIETKEQLLTYQNELKQEMTALINERKSFYNNLRRCKDDKQILAYKEQISGISKKLPLLRRGECSCKDPDRFRG
jgi:flagellar motility protein MotE (MotC chaperone)